MGAQPPPQDFFQVIVDGLPPVYSTQFTQLDGTTWQLNPPFIPGSCFSNPLRLCFFVTDAGMAAMQTGAMVMNIAACIVPVEQWAPGYHPSPPPAPLLRVGVRSQSPRFRADTGTAPFTWKCVGRVTPERPSAVMSLEWGAQLGNPFAVQLLIKADAPHTDTSQTPVDCRLDSSAAAGAPLMVRNLMSPPSMRTTDRP